MSFDSITNRGEFFSNHYLDAVIGSDIGELRKAWDEAEGKDRPSARSSLRAMPAKFFAARAIASEASRATRSDAVKRLNDVVLSGLGFTPGRQTLEFKRNTVDLVSVPVAGLVETSAGLLLIAIDAGLAQSADDLFDDASNGTTSSDSTGNTSTSNSETTGNASSGMPSAGLVLNPAFRESDKKQVTSVADTVGELFAVDEPPRFVLVVGGRIVMLAERAKWAEGRFLAVDLDAALERNDSKARGELETIAALFSADAIVPGHLGEGEGGGQSLLDELVEKSHKHAVGVSKDLRIGIRESIEIIANEVIDQRDAKARAANQKLFTRTDVDAKELTRQSLRYLYRLLVLLYAESRPELGILPVSDEAYLEGYSLDRLRELCLVELDTEQSRNGTHLNESLNLLFHLVNDGRHQEGAQQQFNLDAASASNSDLGLGEQTRSNEDYLQFPGLDAELFDQSSTSLINEVDLRNDALQQVLKNLMLSKGKGKGKAKNDSAGFISYAQLGINQLGAVYEGLMAYSGFFAHTDLYEVAKGGDPADGTWMVETNEAHGYPDEVFVTRPNPHTGQPERVLHRQGGFVFRLAGRDRQRSASYYTPEVLTRCVVKHALAELLGLDDYAPVGGSAQLQQASDILNLTICEPALGSGAFLNEAINQLSAVYLKQRQAELGESLDPERYNHELQKVKAHFALNQSYGVDLNATAVELAEVSLWLNAMYPGLSAPWFGLQLRNGNSLVGCRRATWNASQLGDRPWNKTKKGDVLPPKDRPLAGADSDSAVSDGVASDSAGSDNAQIHHFLLPGHGWAAVANRKEAKELRPDEVAALKDWRKAILAAPKKTDANRLVALTKGVEARWAVATEQIRGTQRGLRRNIHVYGAQDNRGQAESASSSLSREAAAKALADDDSSLGRLRALMDAWTGLWFWPLDTGVKPPSWSEWLDVAEALIRPEASLPSVGQLDMFEDLDSLNQAEQASRQGQTSVAELGQQHPWLAIAIDAADREGAFHWDLEFAPVFQNGGFDLQVGNPPWVRPRWLEDLVLAEHDPWWGITNKPGAKAIKARRAQNLSDPEQASSYLAELASADGVVQFLGSPVLRPLLTGIQTNLYMVFMDTVWRHAGPNGTSGLLHPESHFTDPKAGDLRRATYGRLRRHWQFLNGLKLFEDIHDMNIFGIHVSGGSAPISFHQMSSLQHPDIVDRSLEHNGSGKSPSIQYPAGGWDLRPHKARIVKVDESVLADWAKLFDEPGTPAAEARLLRPVTTADLEALSVLADQPVRLADHDYHWTRGHEEDRAKTDGTIRWETKVPDSWDEVILQGPHFSVATPFNKQPNENCKHNQDYSEWDLENLPETVIPRTNYQRACSKDEYQSRLDHWNGRPSTDHWRFAWRRMTQPGLERSLQGCLVPPGLAHVHTVHTMIDSTVLGTVVLGGLWSSLPVDYLVKVSGKADIQDELIKRFPGYDPDSNLAQAIALRFLRLNCLTRDYAPLWNGLRDPSWQQDAWTDPELEARAPLATGGSEWSMTTPLRRDQERWQALVELDALAALMLGLSAEQLCAMYRTQFAVLRKYEYKMVFDAEGRKICGYHQSAGFRQSALQDRAKLGGSALPGEMLPKEWKRMWDLVELHQDGQEVGWLGHYTPPFKPADREAAMTTAYHEFQRRYPEAAKQE